MLPVLFSIGKISISSFGVFLALGFFLGVFLAWRLGRAWDFDEEKTLDLTLLTILGGLTLARVFFVIEHWQLFAVSPLNLFLINRTPGFSFWGGFLGGWLSLYLFAKRFKINFWQAADIASVAFLGGLIFSDLGCFLGACDIGTPTKAFFAVSMAGFVGSRWPVQLIEALILGYCLLRVWSQATHFHPRGKIVSQAFIYIGTVRLVLLPLKQNRLSWIFSLILILLGLTIYYRATKQNPAVQFKKLRKFFAKVFTDSESRKQVVQNIGKSWYNRKTAVYWKLKNLKKILRRFNVKFS